MPNAPSAPAASDRPRIIYSPPPAPDVQEIARRFQPDGFEFEMVPAEALPEALPGADFLMGFIGRLSDEALTSATHLRLVQLMSVGYDTFNLEGARAMRLPVAVNGGANAIAVAEHAIMLMLATLKRLTELNDEVHGGGWRSGPTGSQRLYELWHSTVGIVGMGRIGQQVAQRLHGWESRIVYFDPHRLLPEREQELGVTYLPLEELLRESDVVSVHVPLSERTRHLINRESLALMKPNAVLVNTSRGELVDETALVTAVKEGRISGAGLDVLSQEPPPKDHPLFGLPNVVLTPHVAGPTWQSWPRRFENCFANIVRVAQGEPPQWVVPELVDQVTAQK